MDKIWQAPLYVWLAAIFPIASIASQNPGEVQTGWIGLAMLVAVVAVTILMLGFKVVFRDWSRAGLAVLVTVLAFYAYGPISAVFDSYWLEMSDHGDLTDAPAAGYVMPLRLSAATFVFAGIAILVVCMLRSEVAARVTRPLNFAAIVLIAFPSVQAVSRIATYGTPANIEAPASASIRVDQLDRPDIYYIVLDGYARDDVLAAHYRFDNSEFLSDLKRLGFQVVENGNANYYWTFLSLASSLNMEYVQDLLHPLPSGTRDPFRAYEAIRDNAVARFLQGAGYRYVQLQSSWGATLVNPYADSFVSCGSSLFTNEFFRTLVEASWLRALSAFASSDLANCHTTNMQSLIKLAPDAGPKFVFAHFILPHHPYLFDREGRVLKDATIANQFDFQEKLWEDRDSYIEQLNFVNDSMLSVLEGILAHSNETPVVLIHSDHGPQLIEGLAKAEQHKVRLANFAAYFAPGEHQDLIPDGDTPVNYFRRIFNEHFDAGLPILENRSFYSRFNFPYELEEVSLLQNTGE